MQLDSVLTVAIGRNGSDGTPMNFIDWELFQTEVQNTVNERATLVYTGQSEAAIGSDGNNDGQEEDSFAIIAINVNNTNDLRWELARILKKFGQGSACFSYDSAHEPVFATDTGWRDNG